MHIPGHESISTPISLGCFALSIASLSFAIKRLYNQINKTLVLKLCVLSAYIIFLQMIDVPVGRVTSAHLLGSVMAAAIIGPIAASIVITFSLLIQAFILGHGSVYSLGANVFNMAFVATWAGWAVYNALSSSKRFVRPIALLVGSWISVIAAASACSLEIALSNAYPLTVVLPAMIKAHAVTGIGDGAVSVLAYLIASRFSSKLFLPHAQKP